MKDPRQTAFEALYKIFYDSAYSNLALNEAIGDADISKPFITRLVYGVVERRLTLDYIINKFCSKPKPKVLVILRIGVYQLYFMDKVPSSAAVNESVRLAAKNGLSYYTGLINAVLRKADTERISVDDIDDAGIRYSVPRPLINMWNKAYGADTVDLFLPTFNEKAPVFAVPNSLFVSPDELLYMLSRENIEGEVAGNLVKITSNFDLGKCEAFQKGLFHIEDISSYNAVKALQVCKGDTVLDMCSAPGGKAFTAAEMMNNKGSLYAFDLYESRVKLIESGAKRLGLTCITAKINDALTYNDRIPKADKIICDVPCSGFGIIRRKPEIRYKDLDSIKNLPEIQYQILLTSAEYLKKGGRLLYSTCTLNKRENEKVVERFITGRNEFSVLQTKTVFPEAGGGDGFFYSIIERN